MFYLHMYDLLSLGNFYDGQTLPPATLNMASEVSFFGVLHLNLMHRWLSL